MKNIKPTEWLAFIAVASLFSTIIFTVAYIWTRDPFTVKACATSLISFGTFLMVYSYEKWGRNQ